MPYAVNATSEVRATASTERHHPDPAPAEQSELASAHPDAILGQLSASIAEINQPISAVVMNAEAALWLLQLRPTDTEAIRRLLACIVKDGMRTGDIVNHTRALIDCKQAGETPRQRTAPPLPATLGRYSPPGSMPFVLNNAWADGPLNDAISAFAASRSFAPAPMPAA